ncbi:hemophore-related protein [Mycobacterium hodleri]|uniref:Hemophore-related protein n=2 Tax=Mycolicibacterium hodleri TaxID=49897 RepID=A0A502EGP2_9MYCO|nr:heme-binding protein [Mycolicibacterium hodleri]TPG35670.1 hemophore-related protein [Mycolicibacterium hodleri]
MLLTRQAARRVMEGAIAAGAIAGAVFFGAAPSALADPPPPPAPGCSAADFEQVKGGVSTATSAYFFTHPDVNAFFSTLKGQPRDQVKQEIKDYLDANPQTKSDLEGLRQPLNDMKVRCQ